MELWDALYKDGTLAGRDLVRGEPVPEGLYHLVCEILVRHTDGTYLMMRRNLEKEGYPGYWETTAGGSALKGEDLLFDGVANHQFVDRYRLILTDAVGAVCRLKFCGRIPPGVIDQHRIGGNQIQPGAASLETEQKEGDPGIGVEVVPMLLTVPGGTVKVFAGDVFLFQNWSYPFEHRCELAEEQHFV